VLDADKAPAPGDPLLGIATHVIFSAECLSATTGRRRGGGRDGLETLKFFERRQTRLA